MREFLLRIPQFATTKSVVLHAQLQSRRTMSKVEEGTPLEFTQELLRVQQRLDSLT